MVRLKGVNTAGLQFKLIDAKGWVVGRLAAQISRILQGKDKPTFCPNKDDGDVVLVINARHVEFTGKKWTDKLYRWHTGYPGGLKERTAIDQFKREPEDILRRAVYGMLPKNLLRKCQDRKLRIFLDEHHPFERHPKLVEWKAPPRDIRIKGPLFEIPEGAEPMNPEAYYRNFGRAIEQKKRKEQEAKDREERLKKYEEHLKKEQQLLSSSKPSS